MKSDELALLVELDRIESGAVNGVEVNAERILRAAWIARKFAEWLVLARMGPRVSAIGGGDRAAAASVAEAATAAVVQRNFENQTKPTSP